MKKIEVVNTRNDGRSRFILWFGACGPTLLMVWADHLEDALDECMDWLADNAPGLLCDDEVASEYRRLIEEGTSEEEAHEGATMDMTSGDNGHYVPSWEWGVFAENPSRADVLSILGR